MLPYYWPSPYGARSIIQLDHSIALSPCSSDRVNHRVHPIFVQTCKFTPVCLSTHAHWILWVECVCLFCLTITTRLCLLARSWWDKQIENITNLVVKHQVSLHLFTITQLPNWRASDDWPERTKPSLQKHPFLHISTQNAKLLCRHVGSQTLPHFWYSSFSVHAARAERERRKK